MTLFNTLKINLSNIEQTENGLGVTTDFKTAKENGWVVALGDNQLLRFIRKLKDKELNQSLLDELYQERNQLKSTNSSKKNSKRILEIQSKIDELLFIPDILTVKVDTSQKDYKHLCKNGFFVNISINDKQYNIQYKRLCAGAGQLRRNSAMFVNVNLYDQLMKIMLCGLDKTSIGKINPAKFGAYFALFTSASREVKTPRICVVNDYEYMLKDQMVDWIYELPNGEYDITQKNIDFKMNAFDGSGMICPEMAKVWQENLGLDYLPSSFIVRSPWVKGLCSVFDFRKFAKEIVHTDKIKDIYGVEYDVNEIDVILTKSQFKLWDKYSNWQKYMYYHKLFGHIFSVTRVNKKESDFATPLNYQYIQSNNFTDEQIKKLAEPTANWLNGILQFNPVDVSALMVGYHPECTVTEIEDKLDDPIAKCLLYNQEILKDQYVQKKISALAQKKIDQAKIGKILVEGSYDFLIPDLYAMAENAFGLEVKGLLPYKTMYSRRWVEKGAKCVSTQRSPLVASAENQVLNIYCDDKCREWFKYIEWGNIYNIWDLTIISQSDA